MQLKTNITAVRFVIMAIENVVNGNQVSQQTPYISAVDLITNF